MVTPRRSGLAALPTVILTTLLVCCGLVPAQAAAKTVQGTVALTFAAFAQFDRCTRDAGIDITTSADVVTLAPREYLVHDLGNRVDFTKAKTTRKKIFPLGKGQAQGAQLYIWGTTRTATFNDAPITFKSQGYGMWHVADLPAELLKAGDNVLLLPPGASLAVPVDVEQQPRYSFSTADDGKTWQPIAGELLAHLALHRHPLQGAITSDVIDLADPNGTAGICPLIKVRAVNLAMQADTPRDTAIRLEARTGNTLRPDASWRPWSAASRIAPARFIQWRAVLTTTRHDRTPVLRSVTLRARIDLQADPAAAGLTVIAGDATTIVRSSLPFTYQAPSAKLTRLREQWKLDEVIAHGKTEMEQFVLLRNWVRKQWPHNEGACRRPWDAIDILSAPAGDHGMCVHFGVVYTQCALALGFNARQVILRNHYVSEIWSNTQQKWILVDVESVQKEGWERYGTAIYYDAQGRPLNALEIHRHLTRGACREMTQMLAMTDQDGKYSEYERRYGPEEYGNFEHFAFPPRNDYLDNLEPWEVAHGVNHYHSNGYTWWADDATGNTREYSGFTNREGDLYWTLNQAAVKLTMTERPGQLAVAVDTVTPNLRGFRYRLNGGPWQFAAGAGDSTLSRQAYFAWPLTQGRNTLEVMPRNLFDRDGITTTIVVEKQ